MTTMILNDMAQQRMLGKRFFTAPENKEFENEAEEEKRQNGLMDDDEEIQNRGGTQLHEIKGEGLKPAAIVIGRQRADRQQQRMAIPGHRGISANQAILHHQPASHEMYHQTPANQQQLYKVLTNQQARRRHMERSMTTITPLEDSHLNTMVFRIGIPDLKQTVWRQYAHTHTHTHVCEFKTSFMH
ncbi:SH3 and multiple ankyrin repeat domains protein 1-like, partial [Clarias magur]